MSSADIIAIAFFALVGLIAIGMWRRSRRHGDGSDYGSGLGGETGGPDYADGGGDCGGGGGGD